MRVVILADGRSPLTINWVTYLIRLGMEVHLISSTPTEGVGGEKSVHVAPVGLSKVGEGKGGRGTTDADASLKKWVMGQPALFQAATRARATLAALDVHRHKTLIERIVTSIKPDLVHAMRIPYEGIAAALSVGSAPLLVSVWGNDFTLFAARHRLGSRLARIAMKRADGLHCDCHRDVSLARRWGFGDGRPFSVLPSSGGVQTDIFRPPTEDEARVGVEGLPPGAPVVINPRGMRVYVRNEIYFRAIPLILKEIPETIFLSSGLQGVSSAEAWVRDLGVDNRVRLLPQVPRREMAGFFRRAQVLVSPTEHDGTPNSLLEGMACGVFPVAGNLESIREWITPGENGFLCDPSDENSIASSVVTALKSEPLRTRARELNWQIILKRAEYESSMARAINLYEETIDSAKESRVH